MFAVKLPYYPTATVMGYQTRYGMVEVDDPTIYDKPIAGRKLAKVDTIVCLDKLFGAMAVIHRNYLYDAVAGNMTDSDIRCMICKFYRTLPAFRKIVNDKYFYADAGDELYDSVLKYVLGTYTSGAEQLACRYKTYGAKELLRTHGYIYYSLHKVSELPVEKGVTIIC